MKKEKKPRRPLSFQALFGNNKFVLFFSVISAVILWFAVSSQDKDDFNRTITNIPVTVNYENSIAQDLGLEIIDSIQTTVDVTVTGKRGAISSLTADDFTASVALSSVTKAGTYNLEIRVLRKKVSSEYT